jgi:hypothetical protein
MIRHQLLAHSIGFYDGSGFYPDFALCIREEKPDVAPLFVVWFTGAVLVDWVPD